MLKLPTRGGTLLALSVGTLMTIAQPAAAGDPPPGGGVWECHNEVTCVEVHVPGTPGSTPTGGSGGGGGGSGPQTCTWAGREYPCTDPDLGWFNTSDGCYYSRTDPQPAAGDPAWGGHDPKDGAVYDRVCRQADGSLVVKDPVWLAAPPGAEPPPDPRQVALQAIAQLRYPKPALHTAPGGKGTPLVGMPVWLWTDPLAARPSKALTVRGVTVRAEAALAKVVWHLGDGTDLECPGTGTPYRPEDGGRESPDCGHTYAHSSAGHPNEEFTVSTTLYWHITATIEGTGVQPIDPPPDLPTEGAALRFKVAEVQVLN
ncbi:hypothetical protein LO771_02920 [Streptacidiphilus sp. ASG 303]|uniref:hypothetical protein n=1 Tax=Streptacidiphilus sp. ASG 303 TaxID=2896847 RepID=UPI001E5CD8FC|nr:hypothetical protein [Streptacidiphilus sp. ASG 303]MCD0481386.1 hypothetical protein [Streptacidiphilus sp. ASG 303]